MMLTIRRIVVPVFLAAAAAASGGCSSTAEWARKTQEMTALAGPSRGESFDVQVDGPIGVDVSTFAGNVVISADQKNRSGAKVRVVCETKHGMGRKSEAKAALENVHVSVQVAPGELGQVLQVIATTDDAEPEFLAAHVFIDMGIADGLNVQTARGDVTIHGCEGALNVSTTHGDVRVMTRRPMIRPVTIVNRQGDIDFRVRGESEGTLDCETVRGKVAAYVRRGQLSINNGTDHDSLHAVLNHGGNTVILRTVDGDIRVAVVDEPEKVGTFIFN